MKISKWQIEIFDGSRKKYDGHWQILSRITGLDYLIIGFMKHRFTGYWHGWHDGQHHVLSLIWFKTAWGGKPIIDISL